MTAYLINHLRQPGVLHREVLEYLDRVQATLDPFGGKFIAQGGEPQVLEGAWAGSVIVLSGHDESPCLVQVGRISEDPAFAHRSPDRRRDLGRRCRSGPHARQVRTEAMGSVGDARH